VLAGSAGPRGVQVERAVVTEPTRGRPRSLVAR
jgi:hypothetical protein